MKRKREREKRKREGEKKKTVPWLGTLKAPLQRPPDWSLLDRTHGPTFTKQPTYKGVLSRHTPVEPPRGPIGSQMATPDPRHIKSEVCETFRKREGAGRRRANVAPAQPAAPPGIKWAPSTWRDTITESPHAPAHPRRNSNFRSWLMHLVHLGCIFDWSCAALNFGPPSRGIGWRKGAS